MEFWGVEVKPGQSLKCNPGEDKYIHLSQAAIGEIKKDKHSQSVPLFVTFEGKKLVIGTLSSDSCLQISYDLVFEKEFELSHNWKDGSVYFTGYKTVIADEDADASTTLEGYSDDSESEDLEAVPLDNKANGKAAEKLEKSVAAAAAKPKAESSKPKTKPAEAAKVDEDEDDDDDEDDSSDDESDEEMAEGEDDSGSDEDEDEVDSSEEDVKVTPKKVESGKKRAAAGSESKSAAPEKKAKLVTPAGKTGATDSKKGGHTATPYPNKQAAKTAAKPQTPKSAGSISCKSCSKSFNSDGALQSHNKAKHTK